MSYIATSQALPRSAAPATAHVSAAGFLKAPALSRVPHSPTSLVSTSLQATLGLVIMAGLSLVFCTIAAGALI